MARQKSLYRVTFDPGGSNELRLLDWEDEAEAPLSLPWLQEVERPAFVEGNHAGVRSLGGVSRELSVGRMVKYASWEAAQADMLTRDAALPVRVVAPLELRVLDLTTDSGDSEATRTASVYRTLKAAITSCQPVAHPTRPWVSYQYRVAVGEMLQSYLADVVNMAPVVWLKPGQGIDQLLDPAAKVVQWRNQGSETSAHLRSNTTTQWPPLGSDGLVREVPDFDGSSSKLATAFGSSYSQFNVIGAVVNVDTVNAAAHYICDGDDATNRHRVGINASDKWAMYAGFTEVASTASATTGRHLVVACFDQSSSFLRVDGTQVASGNPGSAALDGMTLGAAYDGSSIFDGEIEELIMVSNPIAGPSAAVTALERWLNENHQLGLSV